MRGKGPLEKDYLSINIRGYILKLIQPKCSLKTEANTTKLTFETHLLLHRNHSN
ncbi:hypothetical protein SLEP1_g34202 [Rubroshorea leprosula]|uniref:Uncharacterized protein n=1 Tax=Rubroshorea leprosula TaxID=152421 RepID=A0AAV5KJC8_9ROSI|nr:hypothetical protein SLEP1_g34202 [Rubroshorea leprosula]